MDFGPSYFVEFVALFRELPSFCRPILVSSSESRSYFGSSRQSFVRSDLVREKFPIIWDITRDFMIEREEKPTECRINLYIENIEKKLDIEYSERSDISK